MSETELDRAKRFIAAKCDDKLAEAQEEADALAKLLDA